MYANDLTKARLLVACLAALVMVVAAVGAGHVHAVGICPDSDLAASFYCATCALVHAPAVPPIVCVGVAEPEPVAHRVTVETPRILEILDERPHAQRAPPVSA